MENQRTCGGCTACCKTHDVHSLAKKAGVWCWHCQIGQGCRIYNKRPEDCQDFRCAWLEGTGLEIHRPDKIRVVPDTRIVPPVGLILRLWETSEGALETKLVNRWTLNNLSKGTYVLHIPLSGKLKFFMPQGKSLPDLTVEGPNRRIAEKISFELALRVLRPA
jgi:hypothetical protein